MDDHGLQQGYMALHDSKSNQELQNIINKNATIINGLPSSMNASQLVEGQKLAAEMKACVEILESRKAAADKHQKMKDDYVKKADERKLSALQNLPYAVSANGQLVAAILEEESGKTQEEIFAWCDELSTIEPDDQAALLNGLVNEKIIRKRDDERYELITICTSSLRPHPYADWAMKKIKCKGHLSTQDEEEIRLVLFILELLDKPLCAIDIVEMLQDEKLRMVMFEGTSFDRTDLIHRVLGIKSASDKPNKYRLNDILTRLNIAGTVTQVGFDNGFNYALSYLGTKEENA